MKLDLAPLIERAFLSVEAVEANAALVEARSRFAERAGAKSFSYEALVPPDADVDWLTGTFLPRLVYHCESTRSPLPECQGVFASLFVGERLHCVAGAEVVRWAGELLDMTSEAMVAEWGTGEVRHPLRDEEAVAEEPAALLPPREGG